MIDMKIRDRRKWKKGIARLLGKFEVYDETPILMDARIKLTEPFWRHVLRLKAYVAGGLTERGWKQTIGAVRE
jgi:hypothetical protein